MTPALYPACEQNARCGAQVHASAAGRQNVPFLLEKKSITVIGFGDQSGRSPRPPSERSEAMPLLTIGIYRAAIPASFLRLGRDAFLQFKYMIMAGN